MTKNFVVVAEINLKSWVHCILFCLVSFKVSLKCIFWGLLNTFVLLLFDLLGINELPYGRTIKVMIVLIKVLGN